MQLVGRRTSAAGPACSSVGPALAALILACAGCGADEDGPIRRRTDSRTVRRGALTTTPVVFATTDYYVRPTTLDAEEGRLRVPEHRGRPSGRTFEVHYVRLPATGSAAGYPVVYLAGGPGGSAVHSVSGDRFPLFRRLQGLGDVIAFSQRGTAFAQPRPVCPGTWSYPLDRPLEEQQLRRAIAPWLARCAAHWRDSLDVAAFNTVESADDLEDLRVALGVEKLNLLGISYGTHLALAYIRRHPDRVHRAVLAGVEGPDHTWKLPASTERVMEQVDAAIRADRRARARVPDFRGSVRSLLERLRREPATVAVTNRRTGARHAVTVGALDLQRAIFHAFGEREHIEQRLLVRLLPLFEGDYRPLGEFAYSTRRENTELVMALSTDCASGASPERHAAIRRQADSTLLGDVANLMLRVTCGAWPASDLGDGFRAPVRADVPVLAISGSLDNRTPPANAEEVLRGFPNGHHLLVRGGAHDDDLLVRSPRVSDAIVRFLSGAGRVPGVVDLGPLRFRLP